MNRRNFIKFSSLASTATLLPNFVKAIGNNLVPFNGKKLVIIQFSGGNDGLNTVVPFRNDDYYKLRPTLSISDKEILKLTDELGFHPSLSGLHKLYEKGYVSIINNVGYPNPNRSHFRSMDIWHTASPSDKTWNTGWLGRYLDAECAKGKPLHTVLEIDSTLSLANKGEYQNALALTNPSVLYNNVRSLDIVQSESMNNDNLSYLYKTYINTNQSAEYIFKTSNSYETKQTYPDSGFAKNMKVIADLIISGCETQVYYCELGGFDTHINQLVKQKNLLTQYDEAVSAFVEDLKQNDKFKDVIVLTFSEFGRRVEQNASGGTDHGTANNVFVIGENLKKPGVYNSSPDLKKLDQGDLIYQIDFRDVYATLIEKVLEYNHSKILLNKFSMLDIL